MENTYPSTLVCMFTSQINTSFPGYETVTQTDSQDKYTATTTQLQQELEGRVNMIYKLPVRTQNIFLSVERGHCVISTSTS